MIFNELKEKISRIYNYSRFINDIDEVTEVENDLESKYEADVLQRCNDLIVEFNTMYNEINKKVVCEGYLIKNSLGRYELDNGYDYYTSGSPIYFILDGELIKSNVEHNGDDYYIVGYKNINMLGLKVQIRK